MSPRNRARSIINVSGGHNNVRSPSGNSLIILAGRGREARVFVAASINVGSRRPALPRRRGGRGGAIKPCASPVARPGKRMGRAGGPLETPDIPRRHSIPTCLWAPICAGSCPVIVSLLRRNRAVNCARSLETATFAVVYALRQSCE